MHLTEEVPSLIRITKAATNDKQFMPEFKNMAKGTILVFDKAYMNYPLYRHWGKTGVHFVTRLNLRSTVQILRDRTVSASAKKAGVLKDQWVLLGHQGQLNPILLRLITSSDQTFKRTLHSITNMGKMGPVNVAQAYKQRWQIEILFKRLKQNLKFTDFLGDTENAIRIQIWCALIATLVTIKRKLFSFKIQPAYSTMVGLVRLHLMRYVDLKELLLSPDDPTLFGCHQLNNLRFLTSDHPNFSVQQTSSTKPGLPERQSAELGLFRTAVITKKQI
ncbi:MAG: IS4 family transposase [Flavobacteriales bacterium]|nr:IS4 family transposase [Flavobacteriales bacterium]